MSIFVAVPVLLLVAGVAGGRWMRSRWRDDRSIEAHRSTLGVIEQVAGAEEVPGRVPGRAGTHVRIVGGDPAGPRPSRDEDVLPPPVRPTPGRPSFPRRVPSAPVPVPPAPAVPRVPASRPALAVPPAPVSRRVPAVLPAPVSRRVPAVPPAPVSRPAPEVPPAPVSGPAPAVPPAPEVPPAPASRPAAGAHPRAVAVLASMAAVAVVVAVAGVVLASRRPTSHTPVRSAAAPARRGPRAPVSTATTLPPPTVVATAANSSYAAFTVNVTSVDVAVVATRACWVELRDGTASGSVVFEGTLPSGATRTIHTVGSFWLRLGNPAGVKLVIDGSPVALPAAPNPFDVTVTAPAGT